MKQKLFIFLTYFLADLQNVHETWIVIIVFITTTTTTTCISNEAGYLLQNLFYGTLSFHILSSPSFCHSDALLIVSSLFFYGTICFWVCPQVFLPFSSVKLVLSASSNQLLSQTSVIFSNNSLKSSIHGMHKWPWERKMDKFKIATINLYMW